ncbi:MarR family winged helix-turn-helix transcriptional regulator [Longirhabdus pacifica]|uniref:MarR family winged helix-turn-helix transcriptional regulator n=1 Tax=Longirhabdus pacifica TaxID=2305227 RepID=UPI0010091652|nr:MarR family transcriptional regulator [Longirhabdus pacifica]
MLKQESAIKLENQLCFAVYACSREMTRLYRPILSKYNLTYPQYLVLIVLWEKGECTVKDLGEDLYLDSGTLTPLLKRMQEAGLVVRTRSQLDERQVIIGLTEQGKEMQHKLSEIPSMIASRCDLQESEFHSLLNKFQDLLKRTSE